MDPLTHFLTGACIGRAGLNRKTAYATLAATLAAEAADLDVFWGFAGPVEGLKHHRGITHTFVGAPVVALVVVGAVGLLYRWSEGRRRRKASTVARAAAPTDGPARAPTRQPVRWGWLYLTALIASLSHLLLDWTNNYGLRPFFPFNPRWYAGSFMFIAEPVLWALLLLALIVPGLLALTDREIGARRVKFRGRGWAIFALCGMAALECWRWSEHAHGLAMIANTQVAAAPVVRVGLEPYPVNPFRWHAILETAGYYQTAEIDTRKGTIDSDPQNDILYKPADTAAVEAAKRTFLGRVYLDWGRWAVVRDLGQEPVPGADAPRLPPGRTWTTVEFSDLRFAYSFRGEGGGTGRPALSGWVYIVDGSEDAGEWMNGREQR
jgi:inner membrane protein